MTPADERDPLIGRTLGRYRIIARLGAGGMGVVYRAHDPSLERDVALKLLPVELSAEPEARARLLAEARAAAALNHPHILTVHEVGEAEGQVFLATELVEGRTLSEMIPASGLTPGTAQRLGAQIAAALAHAHDHGVIHRDLKAANVVVTPDGRAKVLDFGIARRAAAGGAGGPTVTVGFAGTPYAAAPEVLQGQPATAQSDVWSLGVLLFEMSAGRRPFEGRSEYEIGAAILNADPPPLPAQVPGALRRIVGRCLEKEPGRRYRTASEVAAALETIAQAATDAPPAPASGRAVVPAQDPTRPSRIGVIAWAVVVLVIVGFALVRTMTRNRGPEAARIRSLAVLPLENLSRDPEQEYFVDGMTEELITSLANLEGVRVISRTSAMRYKGTTKGIPQIARELGVDAVVEGSALRAGDDVRISAQLIEAATDRHLWAKSYQRSLANVLVLQGEVAQAIAAEIRVALTPQGKARIAGAPVVNPAAYEEYLKGRHEWSGRTLESLRLAIAHFERAIAADTSYAAAWAGLADVYAVMTTVSYVRPRETYAKALEAVRNALRLDPQLAQAHATLAMLKAQMEHDWTGAELEFRTALTLNPSYATAHQWYALFLAYLGRLDEAAMENARARELDPLSTVMMLNQGQILYWQGRHDEAIRVLQQVVRSSPVGFSGARVFLGRTYYVKQSYPAAMTEMVIGDSLMGGSLHSNERIRAATIAGDTKRFWRLAVAEWEKQARRVYVSPGYYLVMGYAQLGDIDRAFHWMDRGFEDRDPRLLSSLRDPMLDPLRSDPRFATIVRKYGLEP